VVFLNVWKQAKPPSEVNEGRWCVEEQHYVWPTGLNGSI